MVSSLIGALALWSVGLGSPEPEEISSYFFRNPSTARAERRPGEPYCPQEGDILLFDVHCPWLTRVYTCFGTGGPTHVALVFKRPDGTPALLEAGPHFVQKVFVVEVEPRLHEYDGTILVRRLRTPLTPEQSQGLTDFSLAQEGKGYALGRLILQGTPIRARGSVRYHCFGKTCLERDRWVCSELTIASMTAAGVLNPREHLANSFYPRDLCFDEGRHDLSAYYDPPMLWYPRPELEFAGDFIRVQAPR
jgi:hypothetical protein